MSAPRTVTDLGSGVSMFVGAGPARIEKTAPDGFSDMHASGNQILLGCEPVALVHIRCARWDSLKLFKDAEIEAHKAATLFSAAAKMLAALEIAEGRLMCIDAQKLDTVARNDDVIDRIRAAIAKARGQS